MGKSIFLKKLTLKNFKGIKDLEIDFYKVTNIYGANATGKTTIFDAFTWLMFDKDSQDRVVGDKEANFQIKTIDKDGNVLHGLQHEVCGILNVDGNDIELRKIYKEKWSKKRGATEKTISTHTVDYIIDDVPLRQKDYKKKVSEIIDDKLFKLITSVLYFSMNIKKEDRRKVLVEITGNIEDSNVINKNSSLQPLLNLLGNKTIEELKISIQAKKRKLNDDIKTIPIRIDEANNSIKDIDFDALEFRKRGIVSGIKSLGDQLLDISKVNDEVLKKKDKLYSLKSKLKDMEYQMYLEANKPKMKLQDELNNARYNIKNVQHSISSLNNEKIEVENNIDKYLKRCEEEREKWFEENKKVFEFSESICICPTCKRAFDKEEIDNKKQELEHNFNLNKARVLKEIQNKGKNYKSILEENEKEYSDYISKIDDLIEKLENYKDKEKELQESIESYKAEDTFKDNTEYENLKNEISHLEEKLEKPDTVKNTFQELKDRKSKLEFQLEEVNGELSYKEQNEKLNVRIKSLKDK
ncbi:recombinase RecF, partial [Clostridium botulinum]